MRTALAAVGAAALLLVAPGAAYADDPVGTTDCAQTAPGSPGDTEPGQPESVCQADGVSGSGDGTSSNDGGAASGCEEDPVICQSGVPMDTPVGCGVATPEPAADTATATVEPEGEQVYCIASGLPPTGGGEAVPEAAPVELPRTGPAPLLASVAVGSWLLLLGVLAVLAGRRTARA